MLLGALLGERHGPGRRAGGEIRRRAPWGRGGRLLRHAEGRAAEGALARAACWSAAPRSGPQAQAAALHTAAITTRM